MGDRDCVQYQNVKLQVKEYDVSSIDKNISYTLKVEPDFDNSYSNSIF